MTRWLLSVDSGKRACGCALWLDGALQRAEYVRMVDGVEEMPRRMLAEVCLWTLRHSLGDVWGDFSAWVEMPRTYGGRARGGADANDLIAEALTCGALVGHLPCARLILPAEWKGSATKAVTEERCRDDLSAEELRRVVLPGRDKRLATNVWDAVGIGLWALKSMGLRR